MTTLSYFRALYRIYRHNQPAHRAFFNAACQAVQKPPF
jgi:hypothetical protein